MSFELVRSSIIVTLAIFVTLEVIMAGFQIPEFFSGIPSKTKNFPFICLVDKTHHDGLASGFCLICSDYVYLVKYLLFINILISTQQLSISYLIHGNVTSNVELVIEDGSDSRFENILTIFIDLDQLHPHFVQVNTSKN